MIMSTIEDPNIELFDVNSKNIRQKNPFSYLDQNGFLLCRRGKIVLVMDDRLYEVREGDLYIYPAFSQTQVHSVRMICREWQGRLISILSFPH